MIKKILLILISVLCVCSCAIQQYTQYSYNNVTVYNSDGTPKEYYHQVEVLYHEVTDSVITVKVKMPSNDIVTISGRNIVVETIILQRESNKTKYVYYESSPRILYPYTYYSGGWHYNRPLPRYHYPSSRPPYKRPGPSNTQPPHRYGRR